MLGGVWETAAFERRTGAFVYEWLLTRDLVFLWLYRWATRSHRFFLIFIAQRVFRIHQNSLWMPNWKIYQVELIERKMGLKYVWNFKTIFILLLDFFWYSILLPWSIFFSMINNSIRKEIPLRDTEHPILFTRYRLNVIVGFAWFFPSASIRSANFYSCLNFPRISPSFFVIRPIKASIVTVNSCAITNWIDDRVQLCNDSSIAAIVTERCVRIGQQNLRGQVIATTRLVSWSLFQNLWYNWQKLLKWTQFQ